MFAGISYLATSGPGLLGSPISIATKMPSSSGIGIQANAVNGIPINSSVSVSTTGSWLLEHDATNAAITKTYTLIKDAGKRIFHLPGCLRESQYCQIGRLGEGDPVKLGEQCGDLARLYPPMDVWGTSWQSEEKPGDASKLAVSVLLKLKLVLSIYP